MCIQNLPKVHTNVFACLIYMSSNNFPWNVSRKHKWEKFMHTQCWCLNQLSLINARHYPKVTSGAIMNRKRYEHLFADQRQLICHKSNTKFGDRAFVIYAPRSLDSLPMNIWTVASQSVCKTSPIAHLINAWWHNISLSAVRIHLIF